MALSTVEAEHTALPQSVKEAVWERRLLLEFGAGDLVGENENVLIKTDNQDALSLASNPEFNDETKTKHSNTRSRTSSQRRLQG